MQAKLAPGNRITPNERYREIASIEPGNYERRLPSIDRQKRPNGREEHYQANVVAARTSTTAVCHEQQHCAPTEAGRVR